jgi:predicted cobalt transporter CbtA
MEEAEVPLEQLHEEIHHSAEHGGPTWISWVALSTAILAVLAAIAGLLSGKHANEAMMSQIESSDQWAYYQAKGIKAAILEAKTTLASEATDRDKEKAKQYQEDQADIKHEAEHKEAEAKANFKKHEVFARSVTMFQIAIAIAAISALTKKRRFWLVSLVFGLVGSVFLVLGLMPH